MIEQVLHSGMGAHKSLRLPYRFESPHPPLPEPGRLMRLFGPVILILIGAVYRLGDEFTVSDPITSQFIRYDLPGFSTMRS